jgi:chromosome segregation ATPase
MGSATSKEMATLDAVKRTRAEVIAETESIRAEVNALEDERQALEEKRNELCSSVEQMRTCNEQLSMDYEVLKDQVRVGHESLRIRVRLLTRSAERAQALEDLVRLVSFCIHFCFLLL